ncbi:VOC family protein [Derxia lacustris]|uniref:VOC family protein n=1 Tax=Derxia lacustris TaxID=764842 RepID=UPI000A175B80|nr:VOC family protein [Derxia lacustris]
MSDDNVIHWFEIPVTDLDRAIGFYEAVFGTRLQRERMGGFELAVFPHGSGVGGALACGPQFTPSAHGVLPYLAVTEVGVALDRAVSRGATVLMPRTELPGSIGTIAVFSDSEGNSIGIHAAPAAA